MDLVLAVLLRMQDITCKSDTYATPTELIQRFLGPQPPPLYLASNLPGLITAREAIRFNRIHATWLETREFIDGNGA